MSIFNYFVKVEDTDSHKKQVEKELEKIDDEMKVDMQKLPDQRGPGRPRKRMPDLLLTSDNSESYSSSGSSSSSHESNHLALNEFDSTPAKRKRIDWFASPLIHHIIEEIRVWKSSKIAVERLKKKFPKCPTEEKGIFDDLNEATVRYWFDDNWKLKEQFATLMKEKKGGRPGMLSDSTEKAIVNTLTKLREKGQVMNGSVMRLVMKAVIRSSGNEKEEVNARYAQRFALQKMNWRWRRTTTGTKLPKDWEDQGKKMLKRAAAHIDAIRNPNTISAKRPFHRSLLINFDQTGVHLVPKSKYTYADAKSDTVEGNGEDDRRQITAILASSADGDMLPLQLIFQGKTPRCEAQHTASTEAALFSFTHSENHWSTQETMKEYMQQVIEPYIQRMIVKHALPQTSEAVLLLDCWSVHTSDQFRLYMKESHKNIRVVYIPPNCTSKLQVADTHLNFPFKRGIRNRFNEHTVNNMLDQLERNEEIQQIDLKLSTLKPLVVEWCYSAWNSLAKNRDYVCLAWQSLFKLFNPLKDDNQIAAFRESSSGRLNLNERFDGENEETDGEDAYESESEDEEKDELDLMQEIRSGTRKSTRVREPPRIQGYMIRTDQIQMEGDHLEEEFP
jgi:hypothetical protein